MTIPSQQLASWSVLPTQVRAGWAHAALKSALLIDGRYQGHSVAVYVQGSYRNLVNTRWDSDVDIVAELHSVCFNDATWLNRWEQRAFWQSVQHTDYDYQQFRSEVLELLKSRFSSAVEPHAKAIEIRENWRRLKVDVLPAMRYRRVLSFDGANVTSTDGIVFWAADGRCIVNWPQQHHDNGVAKHESTGGNYRPSVRMFKNARRVAVERGLLSAGVTPSYFLQGLLSNVPDELFGPDREQTYLDVVNWLTQWRWSMHQFRCQNGVETLFGASPEQWNLNDAGATVEGLVNLWNSWP